MVKRISCKVVGSIPFGNESHAVPPAVRAHEGWGEIGDATSNVRSVYTSNPVSHTGWLYGPRVSRERHFAAFGKMERLDDGPIGRILDYYV